MSHTFLVSATKGPVGTPDRILLTKLTVESRVARRAFARPVGVHADAPVLAETFLCAHVGENDTAFAQAA